MARNTAASLEKLQGHLIHEAKVRILTLLPNIVNASLREYRGHDPHSRRLTRRLDKVA